MKISTLLLLCALCLSGTAAYYSIAGLATIFASAFWPVVAMATILEISKLVVASWLYQKWNIIPALLKVYLTTSVVVLMFITSLGIFGFLSKAHVDAGLGNADAVLKIEQIDAETLQHNSVISRYQTQLAQLDTSINSQFVANRATQAIAARKAQEAERNDIRNKLDTEQKTLQDLQRQKIDLKQKITVIESKVGPIKYIAEFFADGKDVDLDKAVRWMIVIIVMVFDPLAVLMLIAANISMLKEQKQQLTTDNNISITEKTQNNASPTYGQTCYDQLTNTLTWWNGDSWRPMFDANTSKNVVVNQEPIPTSYTAIDTDLIKSVIAQSMDKWLSDTLSDQTETNQKNFQEPLASQPNIDILSSSTSPLTEEDSNTDDIVESENNNTSDTQANNQEIEVHHDLEHFKPTHITYSSRK
jgi:hypothetical protein